jgi:hypothetical protein
MKNAFALTLKPEETQVLLKKEFQTVEELQDLLDESIRITNQHPSVIYVEIDGGLGDFDERKRPANGSELTLQAEGLTDGSVVYNISIFG